MRAIGAGVSKKEGRAPPPARGKLTARRRSAENLRLGEVEDPAALDGNRYELTDWHYLYLKTDAELGEPAVNGRPHEESKFEYKRAGRGHGFLALGATPGGAYRVAFPGGPSFTVNVIKTEIKTEAERRAEAKKVMVEVFSRKDEPLEFHPSVPRRLRDYFESHYLWMKRNLDEYYDYVQEDEEIGAEGRRGKSEGIERLEDFYRGVFEGRENRRTLGALIAQLSARERGILDDLAAYYRDDPSKGRTAVFLHLRMLAQHREIASGLLKIAGEIEKEPPAFVKAAAWVWTLPARLRLKWAMRSWFRRS